MQSPKRSGQDRSTFAPLWISLERKDILNSAYYEIYGDKTLLARDDSLKVNWTSRIFQVHREKKSTNRSGADFTSKIRFGNVFRPSLFFYFFDVIDFWPSRFYTKNRCHWRWKLDKLVFGCLMVGLIYFGLIESLDQLKDRLSEILQGRPVVIMLGHILAFTAAEMLVLPGDY